MIQETTKEEQINVIEFMHKLNQLQGHTFVLQGTELQCCDTVLSFEGDQLNSVVFYEHI